jgi:hypothetical protein
MVHHTVYDHEPVDYVAIERKIEADRAREQAAYDRIHSAIGVANDRHFTPLVQPGSLDPFEEDPAAIELIERSKAEARAEDEATSAAELLIKIREHNPAAMVAIEAEDRPPIEVVSDFRAEALAADKSPMRLIHELARRYFREHPERHPVIEPEPDHDDLGRAGWTPTDQTPVVPEMGSAQTTGTDGGRVDLALTPVRTRRPRRDVPHTIFT